MANNFFDLVKSSFFNPFANGDIRTNYDLLVLINNKMSLNYSRPTFYYIFNDYIFIT